MKLRLESLRSHLDKTLLPVYLVAGDETLLVEEAADAVRAAAGKAGFADREVLFAERGFDWSRLAEAGASLSLFGDRRVLDLRLPSPRPGHDGGKALKAWAAEPPADTLLLLVTSRLDRRSNPAWVKALARVGAVVEIQRVRPRALPEWIARRARERGRELSDEAAARLAERVEGNLLAAAQEIEKLALLTEPGRVDWPTVREAAAGGARYDVYALADAALAGEAARALAVLSGLDAEGVASALVLWALVRDIRILAKAAVEVDQGRPAGPALAAALWRRPQLERALRRLGRGASRRLLMMAAETDRIIKGPRHDESWPALESLTARLAGIETLPDGARAA